MVGYHNNQFFFSADCFFDIAASTIFDTCDGEIVKATQIFDPEYSVLKKLAESKEPVDLEVLKATLEEIHMQADDSDVRRVISDLRSRHEQLGLNAWLPRAKLGKYQLVKPSCVVIKKESKNIPYEDVPTQNVPCVLQDVNFLIKPNFVEAARKDTFDQLDTAFKKNKIAFLVGCGGIGKSEACKHWAIAKKQLGEFNTVVLAQLDSDKKNSIQSLIIDDSIFVLTEGFPPRYDHESKEAYFARKLNKIKQVTDDKTLIILDNYDMEDSLIEELMKGSYKLLVTTRNDPKNYGFPVIRVNEIQSIEHLKEIFFRYLDGEREDISRDDPYIEELFALVANHTLAIELIAKVLRFSNDTPQMLHEKMSDSSNHILLSNVEETVDQKTPFEIIKLLFNLSSIVNDDDKESISQLLTFMAAMPTKGIELALLQKWSNRELKEARSKLVKRSWLQQDEINGKQVVSMHPLIREVVWNDLKPSLDTFPTIVDAFINDDKTYINRLYHESKETKKHHEEIVLSLLHAFPVCNLEHADFYSKILRTLRLCANAEAALTLAEEMAKYYETVEQKKTWEYGFVQYQIGAVFAHLLRQPNKSVPCFEKAIEIMKDISDTKEKKLWLALLYRDIASVKCQDNYLFACQDSQELDAIEGYLKNGEILVNELLASGSTIDNLKIYHGTLCVWRSKIAVQRGEFGTASQFLYEAEENFKNFDYSNAVDKAAIADIRALISQKKVDDKHYEEEIRYLTEASKAFLDGFTEYHYASVERLLKLAKAYINNAYKSSAHEKDAFKTNLLNARDVLLQCKTVLSNMKQSEEDTVNKKFVKEAEALQKEILEML